MLDKKRIALFVDADNAQPGSIPAIMHELTNRHGVVTYRRVYRNWRVESQKWNDLIVRYSMQPEYQASNARGKNSSDIKLIIDAMDALYANTVDSFCIVASDSDYTALAVRLQEGGKEVIGIGERSKVKPESALARACNQFIYVENLMGDESEAAAGVAEGPDGETRERAAEEPVDEMADETAALSNIIAEIVIANADSSGGMLISQLKPALRNSRPDFDERTYGFSSFSKFLASLGDFELDPPEAPLMVRIRGGNDRAGQIIDLISSFVREAGKRGRTLPEINQAVQAKFPGPWLRALGYSRMPVLLADVPGIKLVTRKGGTQAAVAKK